MNLIHSPNYQRIASLLARILIAVPFLLAASFKIPGTEMFAGNVAATAAVGVPFPTVAVTLAAILDAVAGLMIVLGWRARLAAAVLVPYIILLTYLFHTNFSSQVEFGFFIDHLVLIGALLYVSVYGAQSFALRKD